jgi:hypothetical protein
MVFGKENSEIREENPMTKLGDKYASDIQRCIICGDPTRTRGNDCWIQKYGVRVCGTDHLHAFEEKHYRSLHTPFWYPTAAKESET